MNKNAIDFAMKKLEIVDHVVPRNLYKHYQNESFARSLSYRQTDATSITVSLL